MKLNGYLHLQKTNIENILFCQSGAVKAANTAPTNICDSMYFMHVASVHDLNGGRSYNLQDVIFYQIEVVMDMVGRGNKKKPGGNS